MSVDIRRAEPADLPAVQDLNHALFVSDAEHDPTLDVAWPHTPEGERYFRAMITGEIGICLVADIDGTVVGYLAGALRRQSGCYSVRRAEIENMIVARPWRGRGLGSALVNNFLSWCAAEGVGRVDVTAFAPNTSAIDFYRRNGFRPNELTLAHDLP